MTGGDDFAGDRNTTATIAVGGSVAGTIEEPGDEDWFRITLEAGVSYRFDLEGADTGKGTLPVLGIVLYNSDGDYITGSSYGGIGRNARLFLTLLSASGGTYYLAAATYPDETGTYTLSASRVTDDFSDDQSTTATIAAGEDRVGNVDSPNDEDWFRITLEAGVSGVWYRFDLDGDTSGESTLPISCITLREPDGDDVMARNARLLYRPTTTGSHYLIVSGCRGTGTYTLSASLVVTDDFSDDQSTTATIAVGGSRTGNIDTPDDEDWFRITLEAGMLYRFDQEGINTGRGTLPNPYILLHGPGGDDDYLTENNDGGIGRNARLFYMPTTTGTHYLIASAYEDDGEIGTYTLSVALIVDDFSDDQSTTATIAVGGSRTGNIDTPDDEDWFRITLEAGMLYRFDQEGINTGRGTLPNPYILLHGPGEDDNYLTESNDGGIGRNARLLYMPTTAGTYYLIASADEDDGRLGTYTLSASLIPAEAIAVGSSVTGTIETPDDADWFRIALDAGAWYRFDLAGAGAGKGTLPNPYILLHGPGGDDRPGISGIRDAYDDGRGLARLFYRPSIAGIYYLVALRAQGATGTYTLSASRIVDDFSVNGVNTTATIAVGDSVTGDIGIPNDRDWFRINLETGALYQFDLEGADTGKGTLPNPRILLRGPSGNRIRVIDDGGVGRNARLLYAPASAGIYYLVVDVGGSVGTYTLSASETVRKVRARVFLQGAYDGFGAMRTTLIDHLPAMQPYNVQPWNHATATAVPSIAVGASGFGLSAVTETIVDWVLVELRVTQRGAGAAIATTATSVASHAALLLRDGDIVGVNTSASTPEAVAQTGGVRFDGMLDDDTDDLYVLIHHRNHLSIMSSAPATACAGGASYCVDFTRGQSYQNGQHVLRSGDPDNLFAMRAGDVNSDGVVDEADERLIRLGNLTTVGSAHYGNFDEFGRYVIDADLDFDGDILSRDRFFILENNGAEACSVC